MNPFRRKVVFGLVLLAGVTLAAAYLVHFRVKWEVERYERQLAAAGEILALAPLMPPPVAPDNNGASLFNQAMSGLSWSKNVLETNLPPSMRMVAPGKAMVGWAQPDIRSDGTNTWSEVDEALARHRDALDTVREAAERPVFDFQLDYRQGFTLLLPHLAPLKRATQLLSADTMSDLHRGDAGAATTNIVAMLGLVKASAGERLAISQLVRIAMAAITVSATWEVLQSPNLTDEQLAALQRSWAEVKLIEPAKDSLTMERAMGQMTLEKMRRSSAQFRQIAPMSSSSPITSNSSVGDIIETVARNVADGTREASWRLGASYPDQLRALKGSQVMIESFRAVQSGQPFVSTLDRQKARLIELGLLHEEEDSDRGTSSFGSDLRTLFSGSTVALSRIINKVFLSEVGRELTTTALALKRYQLHHGQYPAELAGLVPEFLPSIPRDPADGKPLRYQHKPDGAFLLYSIGEDGVDNGGDASPATKSETFGWQRGRDLVWPTAATPEEVIAYQQRQASKRGR
jgi:hypothetical protein